jgi:hypothetical protein
MSVRNPTSFNQFSDSGVARSGKEILITEYNKAINDQVWSLDMPFQIMSDCFFTQSNTSSTPATLAIYTFRAKDMLDEASYSGGQLTGYLRAYVISSGGTTTGSIVATATGTADTTATVAITAAMTTAQWVAAGDSFDLFTNGDETVVTVTIARGGGAGTVYCGGLWFCSPDT